VEPVFSHPRRALSFICAVGSDRALDDPSAYLNHIFFLLQREVGQDQVLGVGVTGNLMAALAQLVDGIRMKLGAFCIHAHRPLISVSSRILMKRQRPVLPPYWDQEIPKRSGVPGLSEVVISEYGGDCLRTKLQTSP
jgi:hypothetical protein